MSWVFWIDCGGTFTDIIALDEQGNHKVHKVLSHSPHYKSAVAHGIKEILGHSNFSEAIKEIRLGTTVATNAFLERQGIPCALITTLGHKDVLEIRRQNRNKLFEIPIKKTKPLQTMTSHIYERLGPEGEVLIPLDEEIAEFELQRILDKGIKSVAISLLHSTKNPDHEIRVGKIAERLGFDYISLSHQVSPLAKYISRTETSVLDAYLSPYLKQYTEELSETLKVENIFYMQSDGTLCKPEDLKGHNSLLSGPSGGLVGAIDIAQKLDHKKIITFDMGGTSTDVAISTGHINVDYEPTFHGLDILAPMVDIHTVAAGGGSILKYDEGRFQVGPESAKANPGPACYGLGGPLTVTDANLFLGNIDPEKFPRVFGPSGKDPLNTEIVLQKFEALSRGIGLTSKEVAQGFLDVAIETMARAVKKISIERGFDPKDFCMVSFGGAGGQLAAKVCDVLGIQKLIVHPLSSVLSAYGIGQAENAITLQGKREEGFTPLEKILLAHNKDFELTKSFLMSPADSEFKVQTFGDSFEEAKAKFSQHYQDLFGLKLEQDPECSTVIVKGSQKRTTDIIFPKAESSLKEGPHLVSEYNTSISIPQGWKGEKNTDGTWVLQRTDSEAKVFRHPPEVELEVFYQRFQFIAEGMGHTLQKLSKSVNIKERKDFSCALFTKKGELIANAPHIPVHLGSMGDVVLKTIQEQTFEDGDMFLSNSPQSGGTHLPDLTLVAPLYFKGELVMWVASRGHHADIGGVSPGSMPGNSTCLEEEGIIIHPLKIVEKGLLNEEILKKTLLETKYPVRNYNLNLHDIKAKIAANNAGKKQLLEMHESYGKEHISDMAENVLTYSHQKIMSILEGLPLAKAEKTIAKDRKLCVSLERKADRFIFDFTGSSSRLKNNFNAPPAVVKAAVLFCLRCLIEDDIPLNSGIMRSIDLHIPEDCFLNPNENSAVVSGNVETSQALCDVLFDCLGFMANSQGTMNNLSFGNENYQYYETLAGGSGASQKGPGTSGVQVHMTNSLLTDPEVFESRFPVLIELMALRHGSSGRGKFRGGDGISRKLLFKEAMTVNVISQSREIPPAGLKGGEAGQVGLNQKDSKGELKTLGENFQEEFLAGDRLLIDTPGGGGFGEADKEDRALVFSFGSNMDVQQIQTRCPSAKLVTRAYAFDREIRYSLYSEIRKGGVADTMVAEGHKVTGLLVSLSLEDLKVLDGIECGLSAYKRISLTVYDDNHRAYDVFAYDVIDKEPDIEPHKIYEWLVFSGAYRLNTSQAYISRIRHALWNH